MNVIVNSQQLAVELRLLNKIVPSKPAIAILSHVLLTADTRLNFFATDLEVGLSSSCDAHISASGFVALPVASLLALVEQFVDSDVNLRVESNKIHVTCGAFKSKLQTMPVDDFPQPPPVDGLANVLDGDAFRRSIARTSYAINVTSQKFMFQGALLTLSGETAAMVATDGKRLALATLNRSGSDTDMIISAKTLDILSSSDGDVEVIVGQNHLQFVYGGRTLISRTLEGKFPAYERIIPRDNDKHVIVNRANLLAATKRIILVSEDNRAMYLNIEPSLLTLAARSAEVGSADEAVRAEYVGEPLRVCVNGSYLLDFLEASSSASIQMHLKDASSAMLLLDGDDHVGVIMLMRSDK